MADETSNLINKQAELIDSMQTYIDQLEKTQDIGEQAIAANSKVIDELQGTLVTLEKFAYDFAIRQFERQILLMRLTNPHLSFDDFRIQAEQLKMMYQTEQIISMEYIYKLEGMLQEQAEKLV